MSGMIDAEKEIDSVNVEEFEIDQMLKQIVGGSEGPSLIKSILILQF